MTSTKYIGMDVHKESISIAVMNSAGKIVMESVIETKASMILQFIDGLRANLESGQGEVALAHSIQLATRVKKTTSGLLQTPRNWPS